MLSGEIMSYGSAPKKQEHDEVEEKRMMLNNGLQTFLMMEANPLGLLPEADIESIIVQNSEAFRAWFDSAEGQEVIGPYLAQHSGDDIENGRDFEPLVKAFRERRLH